VRLLAAVIVLGVLAPSAAFAISHGNLDERRPLRVEDPYPVPRGEWSFEFGDGFQSTRGGESRGIFPVEVLYGPALNVQLGVGTTFATRAETFADPGRSGDLRVSGLYDFNQESTSLPALGAKLTLELPTGTSSDGVDFEAKGLATKSLGSVSFHLNLGEHWFGDSPGPERDTAYEVDFGASLPFRAPMHTRLLLVGGGSIDQSRVPGAENRVGLEAGLRWQYSPWTVFDLGAGTDVAGSGDREDFHLAVGISIGY